MQLLATNQVYPNKDNPRNVNEAKFVKLKKSIQDFPEMLKLRPVVVDENYIILGGNMRYRAMVELGHKEVWVIKASDLTDEQKQQFIIKDNISFGDWDYDILANEWDSVELEDWGLNVWQNEDDVIANTDEAEPVEKDKIVCALCGK
jgi:ParB-like chromosome segregation protein Spo0J|tara:strand:+ start:1670 stop:2110 length:441 start_codon:yes stop_codon:yes gene_type:complete